MSSPILKLVLLKKYAIYIPLIFLFFSKLNYAQTFSGGSLKFESKTFTAKQGFNIYKTHSILFDDDNYLWISGTSPNISGFQFDTRRDLIQRFNGTSFDDIPLPDTGFISKQDIFLTKRNDGLIYVKFLKNQDSRLYLLDPKTLIFKEIEIPRTDKNEKHEISLFNQKGIIYLIDKTDNFTNVFQLSDSLELSLISKIEGNQFTTVNFFIKFDTYFLINDLEFGSRLFSDKGDLIKTIQHSDVFENSNDKAKTIFLKMWFQSEGNYYTQFSHSNKLLLFNPLTKQFEISNTIKPVNSKSVFDFYDRLSFQDLKGNTIIQNQHKNEVSFAVFSEDISSPNYKFDFPGVDYFKITSRNLKKEIVLANNGTLYYLKLPTSSIHTFLDDISIRAMIENDDGEIIIATENRDWFVLDSETLQLKDFPLTYQNKPFKIINNRTILPVDNGYWTNNDKGLIFIDKLTNKSTPYPSFRINTLTQDDKFIYYGASLANKLMKFDKQLKKDILLKNTDSLSFQKMIILKEELYIATNKGLLVYKDGTTNLYKTTTNDYLLTVNYHPKYGILVGTRSGNVFQFNTETKEFTLLFSDDLKASIATILFDDTGKIWFNTFGGIVAYNPKTKSSTRFGMRDGLSFYEANRHSSLKTKEGHFLVGTLKGLNYFHPDSLYKNTVQATLNLSSLKYYNNVEEKELTVLSSEKLTNIKKIILPVDHRNLTIKFGLTGIIDIEDLEFRYRFNNKEWNSLGNTSYLNLISITPGKQTIELEALDFSKNKIGKSIFIPLMVQDHFYNKWWFYVIVLIGVLIFLFLYLSHRRKKEKNKILEKENKAIKKDLKDYTHQLIKRNREKNLLSEEFNKLKSHYGEQKDLKKLQELATSKILTQDDWGNFKSKFIAAYPQYLISLKNKGYKFTPAEERFITLEKLNLSTEEIANMLGVSVDSVRTSRYRLRKKLNAPNTISITEYLESL